MVRRPLFRFLGCFKSAGSLPFLSFSNNNFIYELFFQTGLSIAFPVRWKIALNSHVTRLDHLWQGVQDKRTHFGKPVLPLAWPWAQSGCFSFSLWEWIDLAPPHIPGGGHVSLSPPDLSFSMMLAFMAIPVEYLISAHAEYS